MVAGLRTWAFCNRLYDLSLGGSSLPPADKTPPNPWWGFAGGYGSGPADIDVPAELFWRLDGVKNRIASDPQWRRHDFDWLNHRSSPEMPVEPSTRDLISHWMNHFNHWHPYIWRTDVLGDRLVNWLVNYTAITTDTDPEFIRTFNMSLNRQARHLTRWATRPDLTADRIAGLQGSLICTVTLPTMRGHTEASINALRDEIETQINADGGHRDRNPEHHLFALARLLHIRQALYRVQMEIPPFLQNAIDRMAPMLRAYRHGDGCLSLFNGCGEGDRGFIGRILDLSGSRGRAASSAPHTGFHRMATQRSSIIMDTGIAANSEPGEMSHAGTLAFELSVGKQRVVVNCGGPADAATPLAEFFRGTAAHSTLVIGDTHSSELEPAGGFGERRARDVRAQRREIDRNVIVEAEHDGYQAIFGLQHARSLYLAADGADIRGEDTVIGTQSSPRYAVRFHLHPNVQASLTSGGNSILLRFGRNRGWRFRASGGVLSLDDSVYFGTGRRQKTMQIVISGTHQAPETRVKWRFSDVGR